MKIKLLVIICLVGYMNTANAQYVGIGIDTPHHMLEVNGEILVYPSLLASPSIRFKPFEDDSSSLVWSSSDYLVLQSEIWGTNPITGLWVNKIDDDLEPYDDNLTDLGTALYRFKNIYAGNGTIQTSDARMKKNISNLTYGIETVMKLRPVSYNWKDQRAGLGRQIGFIAQEVETVLPEAVVHSRMTESQRKRALKAGKPVPAITDPYGMRYEEIIPVLTKAIQEQQAKIELLEKEISQLKAAKAK
jgi:hypothetical protein